MTDGELRRAAFDKAGNAASLLAQAREVTDVMVEPYPPFVQASIERVAADASALAEMLREIAAALED